MAQTPTQRSIFQRITEFFSLSSNNVLTSVRSVTRRWRSSYKQPTNNWARSDYDYFGRLYQCRVPGMELSALLVKPMISKISAWSLGRAPMWKLDDEAAQAALADWWSQAHPDILRAWRGALKSGDAFLVVNADLSVTLLPPDSVDPIVDDNDFATILGWRVTQVLTHPETTQRMTVVDEYFVDRRVHRVEVNGVTRDEQTYRNLLGRIPLVHVANQPDVGEVFGRAEADALLPLLHRYGEVFDAAIEGNVLQGRPTPVLTFETVQDLERFDSENATVSTQALPNGRTERVKTYDIDLSQLLIASGATFSYEAPGSFTADTSKLLEIMFYLILEHSELPEFVFGNAISSSKASADVQMPIWVRYIEGRRGEMAGWLTDIAEIVLSYLSLTTPGIAVATPALQWAELDSEDGNLTLATIQWAYLEGLIDRRTALMLLPITIEDPDEVLDRAQEEADERSASFPETQADERQFDSDLANQIEGLEI